MSPNVYDFLALLAVSVYLTGVGAATTRAVLLYRRIIQSQGVSAIEAAFVLSALIFVGLGAADIPGVLATLKNGVADIPTLATIKTFSFGVWVWLLHSLLYILASGRCR